MSGLIGLLWFDNDPKKEWRQKVREAVARHQEKFWIKPVVCRVNPKTLGEPSTLLNDTFVEEIDGIAVYAATNTLPHHFFVGHYRAEPEKPQAKRTAAGEQLSLL